MDFTARISDLSRLLPKTAGKMTANGWMRWHNGRPSGVVSAQASGLNAGGLEIVAANLTAVVEDQDASPMDMNATISKLRYQSFVADTLTLQVKWNGAPAHARRRASLPAVMKRIWPCPDHIVTTAGRGKLLRLDGTDSVGPWRLVQPVGLSITSNSLSIEPMMLTGRDSETLRLSGKLAGEPLTGSLALNWNDLNLARANAWMNSELVTGSSSGNVLLKLLPQKRLSLTGKFSARGTLQAQGQPVTISQSEFTLEANEQGTRAGLDIHLSQGGTLQGAFTSSLPARLALPDEGDVQSALAGT